MFLNCHIEPIKIKSSFNKMSILNWNCNQLCCLRWINIVYKKARHLSPFCVHRLEGRNCVYIIKLYCILATTVQHFALHYWMLSLYDNPQWHQALLFVYCVSNMHVWIQGDRELLVSIFRNITKAWIGRRGRAYLSITGQERKVNTTSLATSF